MAYFTLPERILRQLVNKGTQTKKQLTKSINRTTADDRNKELTKLVRMGYVTMNTPDEDSPLSWTTGRVTTYVSATEQGIQWYKEKRNV